MSHNYNNVPIRARIRKQNAPYMEEAGQELGFFRSMEEIKALAALGHLLKRSDDKEKQENKETDSDE
ncbi:hypothetical protein [Bacillus piscicola]|uniref:hypothetical protein n=1 Tax=Bacillus piscicola TaxID=1632684 RepID=UPI001F0959D3|nr:hypothetical protein [Bacillus piscicola]